MEKRGRIKDLRFFIRKEMVKEGVGWSVRYIIEMIFYLIYNDKKRLDSR